MPPKTPAERCNEAFPNECDFVSSIDLGGVPNRVNDNCQVCINAYRGRLPSGSPRQPGIDCSQIGEGTYKRLVEFNNSGCNECKKGKLIEKKRPCKRCKQTVLSIKQPGMPGNYGIVTDWEPSIPATNECLKCVPDRDPENESGEKIINKCDEEQERSNNNIRTGGKYTFQCETSGAKSKCVRRCTDRSCSTCEECVRNKTGGDDTCVPLPDCQPPKKCIEDECICPFLSAFDKETYEGLPEVIKPYYSLCPNSEPYLKEEGCGCQCECRQTTTVWMVKQEIHWDVDVCIIRLIQQDHLIYTLQIVLLLH